MTTLHVLNLKGKNAGVSCAPVAGRDSLSRHAKTDCLTFSALFV
jgi:hypothetical protein